MGNDWESAVADPKERKVFEALSDPRYDFRTLDGITNATGLAEGEVIAVLSKYPELIRKSPVPDRNGRELFTLRSHGVKGQEWLAQARTFASKSVL